MDKVFAILDAESHSAAVCDHAAWAAMQLGLPLSLVHVLNLRLEKINHEASDIDFPERLALHQQIEEAVGRYRALSIAYGDLWRSAVLQRALAAGVRHCDASVHSGSLSDALSGIANTAALIVVGMHHLRASPDTQGRDFSQELAIRSVNSWVLACTDTFIPPTQFLLAYDGLLTASNVVESIAKSPLLTGATCHLIMVADAGPVDRERIAWAQSTLEVAGFRVVSTLLEGEAHLALQDYAGAHNIGLVVMGAYRQARGLRYSVDGTLSRMLRTCPTSCLILN